DEALFYYRIRSSSALRSQTPEKIAYMRKYITAKHYDFFQNYLGDVITLYWQCETNKAEIATYKRELVRYERLVQQLSLPNRLKRLLNDPTLFIKKAKQLLRPKVD
ncbi:MAG TPA: hypothetical protein VM935_06055, partial [Chitinophagaceae bacterium]|nr:hypothetical protein [Chitinophagaceae bacterium]